MGATTPAPSIHILLSLSKRQGCTAPLRGFALDPPKRSAVLLSGGMRDYALISVFAVCVAADTDSQYVHGLRDARHISIPALTDLRY